MITLQHTDSSNSDFVALVKLLDLELAVRDGDEHAFYSQFNSITTLRHAVLATENGVPVACGAMRAFAPGIMEIKRMYTLPEARGQGIAVQILAELEAWAAELEYQKCVLETGVNQPEAITLYNKCGYRQIPNYGQYSGVGNSLCFEKEITPALADSHSP
ncbi:MAG: GNAT family N-acetyltransferase [Saprospiraceae bacterium]